MTHLYYLQDINQINTHADEMDLFTMVTRRFKKVFSKQEQMRTFPVYDASIEVSKVLNRPVFLIPYFLNEVSNIVWPQEPTQSQRAYHLNEQTTKSEFFV